MVLESLVVPEEWEKHPIRMLVIGFLYASIGLFAGMWVFGGYASLASVFLTSMPLVIIMYKAIKLEEALDLEISEVHWLVKTHWRILSFFLYLFVGLVAAYALWYTLLPPELLNLAFESQLATIQVVNAPTGAAIYPMQELETIWLNNLRVLVFCIFFSFLYGAGAIFILSWNASVIGVAAGSLSRGLLERGAEASGQSSLIHYFSSYSASLFYAIHGLPEIAGYFLGALAGGIISVAVVNHEWHTKKFKNIVLDSIELIVASILVLIAAGLIEVYVTPALI